MPYPLSPPPASDTGALTYPRTLQRWLDDNPVSKLTRVSTFINLPPFQQSVSTWNGYTDIVFAYNFEGPNNFSLKPFKAPVNPNYTLCVSWNFVVTGQVVRYVLWLGVGATSPLQAPMYNGQPIIKNFRLEIWNTDGGIVSNANQLTFFTSKLGGQDYRWATDFTLVVPDAQVSNFNNTNPSTIAPPFDPYEIFYGDEGLNFGAPLQISSWDGQLLSRELSTVGSSQISRTIEITPPRVYSVSMFGGSTLPVQSCMQSNFISNKIAMLLQFTDFGFIGTDSNIINTGIGGLLLSVVGNQFAPRLNCFGQTGIYNLLANINYVIIIDSYNQIVYLYMLSSGKLLDTLVGTSSTPYNSGSTTILGPGSISQTNPNELVSGGIPLESGGQTLLK